MTEERRRARRTSPRTAAGRRYRELVAGCVRAIDAMRRDAGLSMRTLAAAADLDPGYVSQVFASRRVPSAPALFALADAVGGSFAMGVYAGGGPRLRDGLQARMVEALLQLVHGAWRASVEVRVSHPSRGFIDIVLDQPSQRIVVPTEVHSRIDRLEQTLRRAQDKADALPSADMWTLLADAPAVSRLLVVRSTATNRDIARRFNATLSTAYPGRAIDAYTALTTPDTPWPGSTILWADVAGDHARILPRPPRGVPVGR